MLLVWFLLLCTGTSVSAQYYGMKFHAHEYDLDQRSGLNLTPDRAFEIKDKLELQFYLRLEPNQSSYYGHVFRMIFGEQNIDLMHGFFTDNPNNFSLIFGDYTSEKIAFQIPLEELKCYFFTGIITKDQ